MNLRELVDGVDVPATRVAEEAWDRARERVVRRRVAAAGAAGVMAVVAVVGVSLQGKGTDATPAPQVPSPTAVGEPGLTVTEPDWAALAVDTPSPGDDAPAISTDPVDHASLAISDPLDNTLAYVLGDDGGWRRVDVEGLVPVTDGSGYEAPVVRPTSLGPGGTMLALPQPDALVVVDLTTGVSQRFDVPGPANTYAVWHDTSHVLVAEESQQRGTLVDIANGTIEPSSLGRATRVLADGSALTWDWGTPMTWDDGREVSTSANNNGGYYPQPPLVSDDGQVVVGLHAMGFTGPETDDVMRTHNGFVAVDGDDGTVLGVLPLGTAKGDGSTLLGWSDGLPVLGLVRPTDQQVRTHVVVWDFRNATVQPLAVLPSWWVTWGVGL